MRIGSIFTLGSGHGSRWPSRFALLAKVTLAALVLLMGFGARAAHAEEMRLSIDPGFSMYERATILQAVNEWNAALQGARRIEIAAGGWVLKPSDAYRSMNLNLCQAGLTNRLTQEIDINHHCMPRGALGPVVRHEIGHMLGLQHIPHTLMDPTCCFDAQAIDPVSAQMARGLGNAKFTVVTR
jgi:hypothetical protein